MQRYCRTATEVDAKRLAFHRKESVHGGGKIHPNQSRKMRYYLIRDDRVTVLNARLSEVPPQSILVQSVRDLDQKRFPVSRMLAIWNRLPGNEPIKRFPDRSSVLKKLWAALEALPVGGTHANSKQAQMITLLRRSTGASMKQLVAATGWQAHSVRGVLSGIIKKKLNLSLSSSKKDGERVYRIAA